MRVALVSSGLVPVPPARGGAVEEYVFQLASNLNELGIDTDVIDRSYPREKTIQERNITRIDAVNISCTLPKRDIAQELVFGLASLKKLQDYDLIHANTAWVGFVTGIAARKQNQRLVYTCHNPLWPTRDVRWSEMITRKAESYAMKRSDAVIGLNSIMKDSLHRKASIPLGKISIVPNGVDTVFFFPRRDRNAIDNAYGFEGKKVLLFVGKISPVKGVEVLLKAYKLLLGKKKHCDLKLCVVGPLSGRFTRDQTSNYARTIMDLSRRWLPPDSVVFTGAVSREQLRKLYARADVFVLPSFAEAFALVLLEAMASGCPLVGSDAGGIVDVIKEGTNGLLFKTGDPVDLASKLDKLLSDDDLRKSMGVNSRNLASEVYSWRSIAEKLAKLYERVLQINTI